MKETTKTQLATRAARRTLEGVEAAESVGTGCAYTFLVGLPVALGFLVALVWPWVGGLIGVSALGGVAMLGALARGRTARARPVLEGLDEVAYPTLSVPVRIPRGERTVEGIRRVWRVQGVARPNGRLRTAEVVVSKDVGPAWFVVWPVGRVRPGETRNFDMVLEPVLAGYLVASPEPADTARRLRDPMVRELLNELVGEHDEVAVYPFALWWRTRGPVDRRVLRAAEARLVQLTEVLEG